MAIYGYAGKMARIDLSTGRIEHFMPPETELVKYLGGKGLAAKIIYDETGERVEAFSEENLIVISTSPLNASGVPSSSRFNISTISPLTGLLVASNCGGDFGLHLKRAGYDALVISGKSPGKVLIKVTESGIELCDASKLWGKTVSEAQAMMGAGGKLAIGVAGENLVRYACVVSGERVAGRGGAGAVLGYKQVKGIVAEGNLRVAVPDPEKLKNFSRRWIGNLKKHAFTSEQLPKLGTLSFVRKMQANNMLATKNFSSGRFDGFELLSGETLRDKHLVKNKGCTTCPIQCGRIVKMDGQEVKGPELESLGLLGPNLMNDDLSLIIRLNHLCDELGMDTVSFGSSVGFAMELNEKGLWDNGLCFGDCKDLESLAVEVAHRAGKWAVLAEGVRRISEIYGGSEFAIQTKGLEFVAYEPRGAQGLGLGYATSNRGGCNLDGGHLAILEGLCLGVNGSSIRGKAVIAVFFQDLLAAVSAGGSCLLTSFAVFSSNVVRNPDKPIVRLYFRLFPRMMGRLFGFMHRRAGILHINAPDKLPFPYAYKLVTGSKMDIGRFIRAGERIYNLERLVDLRQGLTDGDTLPARLTEELQRPDDPSSVVQLAPMLKKYYKIRGWDEHGVPTEKRLKKLGLLDAASVRRT